MYKFWTLDPVKLKAFAVRHAAHVEKADKLMNLSEDEIALNKKQNIKTIKLAAKYLRRIAKSDDKEWIKKRSYQISRDKNFLKTVAILVSVKNKRLFGNAPTSNKELDNLAIKCMKVINQSEKFTYTYKQKNKGGKRLICSFEAIRYTQQTAISMLISAACPSYPDNYTHSGREGCHGSARAIGRELLYGNRYVLTADIKNCHSSIRRGHIRSLNVLDERLLRYVVFPSFLCNSIEYKPSAKSPPLIQLPQGGAHSSAIQSALIDGFLAKMPKNKIRIIVFADNLAICAPNVADVLSAFNALKQWMLGHPAGGLMLHEVAICDGHLHNSEILKESPIKSFKLGKVKAGVDFGGYSISMHSPTSELRYRPSHAAWEKFWDKVMGIDPNDNGLHWSPIMGYDEMVQIALNRFMKWSPSFPLWQINRKQFYKHIKEEELPGCTTVLHENDCVRTALAAEWFLLNLTKKRGALLNHSGILTSKITLDA
ncbi:hypothetical protein JYT75_01110 [Oceanicaulis sp. AH-315-P02]|nr:hypothetical protein [Robiginitomaculum sp.]MBN4047898.1 hypothetical protein [Oceanicaulis sp. AH-315-P02]